MSYENTSCPCGGRKERETMICADCVTAINGDNANDRRLSFVMTPNDRGELGQHLWDLRQAAGIKSIRDAEELSGVSNAYISQIETGRIKKPSPDILDRLANAYKGSYEKLMELAGHIKPASATGKRRGRLPTFAKQDLTDEEESALLEYLAFLRIRRGRDKSEKG